MTVQARILDILHGNSDRRIGLVDLEEVGGTFCIGNRLRQARLVGERVDLEISVCSMARQANEDFVRRQQPTGYFDRSTSTLTIVGGDGQPIRSIATGLH